MSQKFKSSDNFKKPQIPREPKAVPSAPSNQRAQERKVCGVRACEALMRHSRDSIRKVFLEKPRLEIFGELLAWCAKNKIGYKIVEPAELDKISGSAHHEGIVILAKIRPALELESLLAELAKKKSAGATLLFLESIGNPHNFGAIARTAGYFGVDAILLSGDSAWSESPSAHRTAEGALEVLPIIRLADSRGALSLLRKSGYSIIATSPHAKVNLFNYKIPNKSVLMLGAEGPGLSKESLALADASLAITGAGKVESLNVSAAAAVLLAERSRQVLSANC